MDAVLGLYRQLDGVVAPAVFTGLEKIGMGVKPVSPLTKGMPLIDSPTPVLLLLVRPGNAAAGTGLRNASCAGAPTLGPNVRV